MSAFKFSKIIMGINPGLAKETILSKVINIVDIFRINLSEGFDDNNKKFIDTVMKLDHSKTIILETKGNEIRVRNLANRGIRKGEKILIEYSEYTQEGDVKIYIDYKYVSKLKVGTRITFAQGDVSFEVISLGEDDHIECVALNKGVVYSYDKVNIEGLVLEKEVLSEKDQKDILWGLEYGIHMVAISGVKEVFDVMKIKKFLEEHNKGDMRVMAKIETSLAVENIDSIMNSADGLIIVVDQIEEYLSEKKIDLIIFLKRLKKSGKPIIVNYSSDISSKNYELRNKELIQSFCEISIDGYSLETLIKEDEVYDNICDISKNIYEYQNCISDKLIEFKELESDHIVRDYIIYSAYRISLELDIKAIVCFTENGYTPAKLVSMGPNVPIITFTKEEGTYRLLNAIWGVKGYKISPSFGYENLKKIGKEMIRIIFKGNISLEDKIVIVQANEWQRDEKTDMINGVELYKFKNI